MNLTNQTTVAVVDDDLELGALIGDYLQTNGFKYRLFESGEAFLNSDLTSITFLSWTWVCREWTVLPFARGEESFIPSNHHADGRER